MIIFTDNTDCAERFLTGKALSWEKSLIRDDNPIAPLASRIFGTKNLFSFVMTSEMDWNYLLITKSAPESQYDILIDLGRKNIPLPHGIICLAGEGLKFHGFKGRGWDSPEGNLYLSAHFAPNRRIENYGPGFMVLAAVSVLEAIDEIPGLSYRAGIKWVNDILIDGAKVCGVLAHTIAENDKVTNAVIGIGLNVETTPNPEPTIFVPKAASLNDFAPDPNLYTRSMLFDLLSRSICKNYLTLIIGGFNRLLDRYRNRSSIIGREVAVYTDSDSDILIKTVEGRVVYIGDNLELYLEGHKKPVKRGRLAIK